jgi:hypothetical protein
VKVSVSNPDRAVVTVSFVNFQSQKRTIKGRRERERERSGKKKYRLNLPSFVFPVIDM